jgi:hypothetical protein
MIILPTFFAVVVVLSEKQNRKDCHPYNQEGCFPYFLFGFICLALIPFLGLLGLGGLYQNYLIITCDLVQVEYYCGADDPCIGRACLVGSEHVFVDRSPELLF